MEQARPDSLPDVPDIPASIVASGLSDAPLTTLVEFAMQRLVQSGVPIDRMNVGFRILHPLFDGMSITWTRETGAEVFYAALVDKEGSEFRLSPFFLMLSQGMREWRLRLDRDPAVGNFPILADLRTKGYTDYLALIVAFGGAELHPQSLDGLATSWSTRTPQGFSDTDVAAMRGVLTPLALVFRLAIKDQITKAALNTFHGPLVGGRILAGSIKRGDGERLSAALWYSDLRNSTGLADQLPVDAFLDLLNAYFDCAAGAVMEQGGQVLDIIGDAILAFFPAGDNGGAEACALALEAAVRRARPARHVEARGKRQVPRHRVRHRGAFRRCGVRQCRHARAAQIRRARPRGERGCAHRRHGEVAEAPGGGERRGGAARDHDARRSRPARAPRHSRRPGGYGQWRSGDALKRAQAMGRHNGFSRRACLMLERSLLFHHWHAGPRR